MSQLAIGLLSALLATNQPLAVSNLIHQQTGISVAIPDPNDPEEKALQQVMAEDDAAEAEVDKWIQENNAFAAKGAGETKAELNQRILKRLDSVRKDYEDFLKHYPDNARGHLAYGSFLNDIGEEEAGLAENEKAAQLDPKNPAAWNNLANFYGENGPLTNAFIDYAKAIQLNPAEPVYYENLATTVYLYRKDAEQFYGINEAQVFDKALALYQKAVKLDPDNFPLATDYAESYYGIRPLRTNDALVAWTNALKIAHNDVEREGVYVHLARIKLAAGRYAEASEQLKAVTNPMYADLRMRLERNIARREDEATNSNAGNISTNAPDSPTNNLTETTNPTTVLTNQSIASTNQLPVLTNNVPALTNPPPPSSNTVNTLTNVPPVSAKTSDLSKP